MILIELMLWGQQIGGILFSGYSLNKLTRAAYFHIYIYIYVCVK